jgi:hypothetical protein
MQLPIDPAVSCCESLHTKVHALPMLTVVYVTRQSRGICSHLCVHKLTLKQDCAVSGIISQCLPNTVVSVLAVVMVPQLVVVSVLVIFAILTIVYNGITRGADVVMLLTVPV